MALSTISGNSFGTTEKLSQRPRFQFSQRFVINSLFCLLAWILMLISFASPYWLSSVQGTYSDFVRLGLWDVCFKHYRHPQYQYDEIFNGCHWIYSTKYQNIRDWLQPSWFILVQTMMTLAFIFSTFSLILIAFILMYFLIRYLVVVTSLIAVLQASSGLAHFIAVFVFWFYHDSRGWLQYPNYNQLDWAYYLALASLIFHCFNSYYLFSEAFRIHKRRRRLNNMAYNMQSRTHSNGSSLETHPMMTHSVERPPFRPHFTQV